MRGRPASGRSRCRPSSAPASAGSWRCGFARELAAKYGCAVDVALHAPDREGDQRNWHAHLLATTRKVSDGRLADKCEIELSDAKRLSLGLAPARIEVEAVRQMWADQVNRHLAEARRPERVDHRSLAAQREEAIQKGDEQKAAELDRAPQVKLGWKVVQMERRGEASDRGNQLRQVREENRTRQAVVLDIGQLRDQLARRQAEEAARRQEAEEKKLLAEVEAEFIGKGPLGPRLHPETLAGSGTAGDSRSAGRAGLVGARSATIPRRTLGGKRAAASSGKRSKPGKPLGRSNAGTASTRCSHSCCAPA